ncbi:GMC oxidoreductase, partial [Streptomyces sp. NPDC057757]|uniref:GMC oxidoreductase n=1 Tax=Streptomyces sp. NPDC057757 TaxID=3346241 RepID=UPI00367C6FEF
PGVGSNLHDQPAVNLQFAAGARLAADLDAFAETRLLLDEQALAKLRSPYAGNAPYDLHIYPWTERDAGLEHGWRVVVPVGLLRPKSRGTVRLRSADPTTRAAVDHAYLTHPDDLAALVHGATRVPELDLAHYLGEQLPPPPADTLPAWIRATHQHYWHPAGSCRMGPAGDPAAVVDHTGKVHGLEGLHVADASVFPDIPRATPAHPTAVVGERIASFLVDLP